MSKTVTLIAATLALSTIALAPANAGAAAAGMVNVKQLLAPAAAQSQLLHKTGKKGRFYAGLAIGLGTAAIIHHGYHRRRHWWRKCRRWRRWCWRGSDRACWKYHTRCY